MPSFTGEAPARASMTTGGLGGEEGGREGGEREKEEGGSHHTCTVLMVNTYL